MSRYQIAQDLAAEILTDISWLAGDLPGDYLESEAFGEHNDKEWQDGSQYISIPQDSLDQIESLEPRLGHLLEQQGECDLLGAYFQMDPRGQIELYCSALSSCFWQLALQLLDKFQISAWQLSRLAEAWVEKTIEHEKFHHRIDMLMVLFGTHPFKDRLLEEALAVACSYQRVSRSGGSYFWWWDKLPEDLRTSFLDCAYRYTAPGYRDWKIHQDRIWVDSTISYVVHPNAKRLLELACKEREPVEPFANLLHEVLRSLRALEEIETAEIVEIHYC